MKILGFDIGISSIGWAFLENGLLQDCGVRIFTEAEDPKDGSSLALPRREARGVRRTISRRKLRLNRLKVIICKEFNLDLKHYLADDGTLPKAFLGTLKNPYELRAKALKQLLTKEEFARVILHIAKHRGYGNKHAKDDNNDESKTIGKAIKENEKKFQEKGYESIGEYLYKEFWLDENARRKELKNEDKQHNNKQGNTAEYLNIRNKEGNYERTLKQEWLKDELNLIFKKQLEFGFKISDKKYQIIDENGKIKELDFKEAILETAFLQRPLKSFADKIGKCTFFEDEPRGAKDSMSAMEFVALTRIINTLSHLSKISGEVYSKDKIGEILEFVMNKGEIKYKELRKILNLHENLHFPKDSKLDYTKDKAEDAKFIEFAKLKGFKKALGGDLSGFDRALLDEIATLIAINKSKDALKQALQKCELKEEQIEALSNLNFDKFNNLSLKALNLILPLMRQGLRYDEAVQNAGLKEVKKHSNKGDFLPPLNEYEPYLANPVVARALSEYRKVLNALLKKYGKVHKIHLELAREVGKNFYTRKEYEREQKKNLDKINEAKRMLDDLRMPKNDSNILKIRLWKEQGEFCAYNGGKICNHHLKDETALQIDHIYPYSRSFDDSYMNKVLVFTQANQNKLNKTPFEAFGEDKEKWELIKSFAKTLPEQKYKRILNENFKDKQNEFKQRNLNDTQYIARLALNYTKDNLAFLPLDENECTVSGEKNSKVHIEVISGTLTANLRRIWGFDKKDRNDHLHHALDAIIIAHTNASMIQKFSLYYKEKNELKSKMYLRKIDKIEYKDKKERLNEQIKAKFCLPYGNFRQIVEEKMSKIFVSKPPRKRARGALHKETFRGIDDEKMLKAYGGKLGIQRAINLGKVRQIGTKIVDNGTMVRVDIFKDKNNKFYGVPIYTMDFALGILPNRAVVSGKDKNGVIKEWLEMDENYEFCFSLFKDDLILVQKKEMQEAELCYYVGFGTSTASINVEKHDNHFASLTQNQKLLFTNAIPNEVAGKSIGIQNLKSFEKYQISPLGEYKKAEFKERENISLKSSPKGVK